MVKYFITIVDRKACCSNLIRTEEDINQTIEKELGGWDNLHSACTSGANKRIENKEEYFMSGTTRDGNKGFSIICMNL